MNKKEIAIALMIFFLGVLAVLTFHWVVPGFSAADTPKSVTFDELSREISAQPEELIRFHVVANSDDEEDQALKRAVRDAILQRVAPILALSKSIEESRQILLELRPQMEEIARQVVTVWGHDEVVTSDYGKFQFPTKSYGTLVLPAGEYEAVRILIGKAEGSNWWCVLFPPLCFIDVDQAVAVDVDGKPGKPEGQTARTDTSHKASEKMDLNMDELKKDLNKEEPKKEKPKVKFFFWEKIKSLT